MNLIGKCRKLLSILFALNPLWFRALRFGVAASIELRFVLNKLDCKTIVDIGANRGQFALMARHSFPGAKIISFEPLPEPSEKFRQIFLADNNVVLHNIL